MSEHKPWSPGHWIIGLIIGAIGIGIYYRSWWVLIGIITTLTAVVGYCPLRTIPEFKYL